MYLICTFVFGSVDCLDVQRPPEVCYNRDGIMIMTGREMIPFSSDMPAFIICATRFLCDEFNKSVHGDGFWLCYEWGEVNRANTLIFLSNLVLINYAGVFPCRTLSEEAHAVCPTSTGSEMPSCVLEQLM